MARYVRAELEELAERLTARLPAEFELRVEHHDGASILFEAKSGRQLANGTIRSLAIWLEALDGALDMLGTHVS
jgi:hypothetical protein